MECVNYVKKYAKYFTPNRKCFCRSSSISSAGGEAFFQDSNQDLNINFCNFFYFFLQFVKGSYSDSLSFLQQPQAHRPQVSGFTKRFISSFQPTLKI